MHRHFILWFNSGSLGHSNESQLKEPLSVPHEQSPNRTQECISLGNSVLLIKLKMAFGKVDARYLLLRDF